jgi:hypothetical protein
VQTKAAGLQLFESSDISFKFVLGLQFSALVPKPRDAAFACTQNVGLKVLKQFFLE